MGGAGEAHLTAEQVSASDGLMTISLQKSKLGRVMFVNAKFSEMLGYADQAQLADVDLIALMPTRLAPVYKKIIETVRWDPGHAAEVVGQEELSYFVRRDGKLRPLLLSLRADHDAWKRPALSAIASVPLKDESTEHIIVGDDGTILGCTPRLSAFAASPPQTNSRNQPVTIGDSAFIRSAVPELWNESQAAVASDCREAKICGSLRQCEFSRIGTAGPAPLWAVRLLAPDLAQRVELASESATAASTALAAVPATTTSPTTTEGYNADIRAQAAAATPVALDATRPAAAVPTPPKSDAVPATAEKDPLLDQMETLAQQHAKISVEIRSSFALVEAVATGKHNVNGTSKPADAVVAAAANVVADGGKSIAKEPSAYDTIAASAKKEALAKEAQPAIAAQKKGCTCALM